MRSVSTTRNRRLALVVVLSVAALTAGGLATLPELIRRPGAPEFGVGDAVGRALRHVVVKAVATPLGLVGRVFSGRGGSRS